MKLSDEQRDVLARLEEALTEERRVERQRASARTRVIALLMETRRRRVPSVSVARAFVRVLGDPSPQLRKRLQSVISTRLWRERRRAAREDSDYQPER